MSNNILHHLSHLALYREHDEENGISEDETSIKSYVLHLSLEGQNQEFWNIFSNKIIPDIHPTGSIPIVEKDTREGRMMVRFKAEKVESLSAFLSTIPNKQLDYKSVEQFVKHSHKTLENLEENGMSVMTFQEEDFIVINGEFFVFVNDLKTIPLRENGSFTLRNIFEKTSYMSPELHAVSKIPSTIRSGYKSSLFSLGLLATQLISGTQIIIGEGANISERLQEVKEKLHVIYHTELYWCLIRCLSKTVAERKFAFF